jgi:hypothetical protein
MRISSDRDTLSRRTTTYHEAAFNGLEATHSHPGTLNLTSETHVIKHAGAQYKCSKTEAHPQLPNDMDPSHSQDADCALPQTVSLPNDDRFHLLISTCIDPLRTPVYWR